MAGVQQQDGASNVCAFTSTLFLQRELNSLFDTIEALRGDDGDKLLPDKPVIAAAYSRRYLPTRALASRP